MYFFSLADCPGGCINGGKCISPNVCECRNGYIGINCEFGKSNIHETPLYFFIFRFVKSYGLSPISDGKLVMSVYIELGHSFCTLYYVVVVIIFKLFQLNVTFSSKTNCDNFINLVKISGACWHMF